VAVVSTQPRRQDHVTRAAGHLLAFGGANRVVALDAAPPGSR